MVGKASLQKSAQEGQKEEGLVMRRLQECTEFWKETVFL